MYIQINVRDSFGKLLVLVFLFFFFLFTNTHIFFPNQFSLKNISTQFQVKLHVISYRFFLLFYVQFWICFDFNQILPTDDFLHIYVWLDVVLRIKKAQSNCVLQHFLRNYMLMFRMENSQCLKISIYLVSCLLIKILLKIENEIEN